MMGKSYNAGGEGMEKGAKTRDVPTLMWNNEHEPQHQVHPHLNGTSTKQDAEETAMTVQRPLIDPLLNDLDQHSRYYMHHFATQLCDVMVVYDMPGQNPIRDLIPATAAYPLLLHVMVANSAFHVFNISRNPMSTSTYQADGGSDISLDHQVSSCASGPLKSSYRDALVAKQQALSLLAQIWSW
jgi:hypothetical protein